MQTEFKSEPTYYEMLEIGEAKPNFNENLNTYDTEMAHTSMEIVSYDDDDRKLLKFLQNINMESLFPILKANQVTFRSLRFIRQEDLKEAVPPLGLRVEFREKLFAWKKSQLGMDDDTSISISSKVDEWLNKNDINTPTPIRTSQGTSQATCCKCAKVLKKDLKSLLNESTKGRAILESALKNQKLNSEQRNDLVGIIVDDIIANDIVLYTQDFKRLVEEICTVLPCEQNMKDYYYIPRRGKNNASGKLYSKHRNRIIKRRKLLTPGESPSIANSQTSDNEVEEVYDSEAVTLKLTLCETNMIWSDVCEMWRKTYNLRQKDIKTMESSEVLKAWPKLATMKAPELINIDFDLKYPNKGNLLFTKWETFKTIIRKYYDTNIHNEYCKQLLAKITPSTSIDSQDYIFTIMLNAVLPSPARFENQIGKRRKRVTIADSQESLVLRLTTLNNYEQQIQEVTNKYYATSLTIQPLMIVEGLSEMHITGFYVYFNNNLLKFNSFLQCLDTCFKIFQTLSLKYPEPCVQPWLFIQKCLYEINRKNDFKSSNMSTLMHFYDNENI